MSYGFPRKVHLYYGLRLYSYTIEKIVLQIIKGGKGIVWRLYFFIVNMKLNEVYRKIV